MLRLVSIVLGGLVSAALVVLFVGVWALDRYQGPGPLVDETVVVIPAGSSVRAIAERLEAAGVIDNALLFRLGARFERAHQALRAGEYAFPPAVSASDVVAILRAGRTVARPVTVPEGLTVKQVAAVLAATPGLNGEIESLPPEGSLLPETYHVSFGDSRAAVIRRMQQAMDVALAEAWADRAPDLPLASPEEALVLASIVQKEAGSDDEAPRIAGVFVNRLRRGMPLQADPTVLYAVSDGLGRLDRPLTSDDLKLDSPYNTYRVGGLPPGPIANPGRVALAAATRPAETDALYFVADGTGGHAFAKTLQEHNRNVARWRKLERERRSGAR